MLTVYGAEGSPFTRKVRVALAEKGLDYHMELTIPRNVSADYKKISPLGKIPAFRDGDVALCDSSVICAYLEKKYPNPPLYPSDPHDYGKALWFEEYGDTAFIQVVGGKIFFPRFIGPMIFQKSCDEAAVQKAIAEDLPPVLDYLEGQVRGAEPLVGKNFSIADITIGSDLVNFTLCGLKVDAVRWPKLARYADFVLKRPSIQKLLDKEKQTFVAAA
jgi:glutathione S-transferase